MGRKVRRVPANWEHPTNDRGNFQPLFDEPFEQAAREWLDEAIAWDKGNDPNKEECPFYWQWSSNPPDPEYYRPAWTEEPTHYQMYETTTEGTPISPVMETPELLARWLADHSASSFGSQTASYEAWLEVCLGGYAPSAILRRDGRIQSGVEAMKELKS